MTDVVLGAVNPLKHYRPELYEARKKAKTFHNSLERRVLQVERKVASNRPEAKYYDVQGTTKAASQYDTGFVIPLNDITQGNSDENRIGDTVRPFFLDFKMLVYPDNTTSTSGSVLRFLIVRSKQRYQPVAAATSGTSQFFDLAADQRTIISPLFQDHKGHYDVVHDEVVCMGPNSSTTFGSGVPTLKHIRKKLYFKPTKFTEASTTFEEGGYYLVVVGDRTVAQADAPLYSFISRFWFADA